MTSFHFLSKKMKFSLQLLICMAAASHLSKEKSHMFLKSVTRSKCGDNCAKSKDNVCFLTEFFDNHISSISERFIFLNYYFLKCHRNCERAGGNVSRCDCCCVNEMKGCKVSLIQYCERLSNKSIREIFLNHLLFLFYM